MPFLSFKKRGLLNPVNLTKTTYTPFEHTHKIQNLYTDTIVKNTVDFLYDKEQCLDITNTIHPVFDDETNNQLYFSVLLSQKDIKHYSLNTLCCELSGYGEKTIHTYFTEYHVKFLYGTDDISGSQILAMEILDTASETMTVIHIIQENVWLLMPDNYNSTIQRYKQEWLSVSVSNILELLHRTTPEWCANNKQESYRCERCSYGMWRKWCATNGIVTPSHSPVDSHICEVWKYVYTKTQSSTQEDEWILNT